MDKMRDALKEDDSSLVVYGCSVHMLNRLGQDITSSSVMKHVMEIQKYFRNHQKPNAWITECPDTVKPQFSTETRSKSQLAYIETFIKKRSSYMNIVHEHEDDFDKQIARKIQDIRIYRNAQDLATQLRPIAVALDKAQSDSHSIADPCHMWLSLQQLLEAHCYVVKKCCKQALTIEHLVAYKLHPRYQGGHLTQKQMEDVCEYFITKDTTFVVSMNPTTWWKAVETCDVPYDFVEMALQLVSPPASSASNERICSSFAGSTLRHGIG
ncbi:hypothetical protein LSH36_602g01037 [Paralvinella palmiformis]|uniref:HAT C-terminal dimerisation domain-containing protein n=1 Tax=Paralvinella palmiformis TaxID=53620 RepID=A0AAD9MUR4_9ANNE|nr:hypothetical protein LSH36_602g01037 [Paralvinella palmiformis]